MREQELKEYTKLLDKFITDGDVYRLLDLASLQHDLGSVKVSQFTYLRNVLARREEETRQKELVTKRKEELKKTAK